MRALGDVDLYHRVVDQGHERPVIQLDVVVRHTGIDVDDLAERPSVGVFNSKTDELEGVPRVRIRRWKIGNTDVELRAARYRPIELHRNPAPAGATAENNLGRGAGDDKRRADGETPRVVARVVYEERAVEPMRPPDAPDDDQVVSHRSRASRAGRRAR